MKRVLAITLTIIMMISSMSIIAFAENLSALNDVDFSEKLEELNYYGIVKGDIDGELRLNDNITRAEVVAVICRLASVDVPNGNKPIKDMDSNHWAYDYVCAAYEVGFVNGYEDGTFRPDENITYREVFKLLVAVLGYSGFAENLGGYPNGYETVALADLNLAHIPGSLEIPSSRLEVFKMVHKSLDIPLVIKWNGEDRIMNGTYDDNDLTTFRLQKGRKITLNQNSATQLEQVNIVNGYGYWTIDVDNLSESPITVRIFEGSPAGKLIGEPLITWQNEKEIFDCSNESLEDGIYYLSITTNGNYNLNGTVNISLSNKVN